MHPTRVRLVLTLLALFLAILYLSATTALAQESLEPKCTGMPQGGGPRLATGPADGTYLRFGRYLRKAAKQLDLRPCRTEGSLENLVLLSKNRVEYAIVQGDMLHKGWEGEEAPGDAKNEGAPEDLE